MMERDKAWKAMGEGTQALNDGLVGLAAAHEADVANAATLASHLGEVLELIDAQGWKSTWAQDNEKINKAREYLDSLKEKESEDGNRER